MLPSKLSQFVTSTSQRLNSTSIGSAVLKNPFWLFLIAAVGVHVIFLLLAPNPLKKTNKPQETEVTSTIPVVKLPPNSGKSGNPSTSANLPNSFAAIAKEPLSVSPLDLNRLSPDSNNLPTSALPSISFLPQFNPTLPQSSLPRTSINRDDSSQNIILPNNDRSFQDSNLKPDLRGNSLKVPTGSSKVNADSDSRFQNNDSPKIAEGTLSDRSLSEIFAKYNPEIRVIAPASVEVRASQKEPGVNWIDPYPELIKGQNKGIVEFGLLVDPSGKVEQIFKKSSGNPELDKIARQTVNRYQFDPIDDEYLKIVDKKPEDKPSLRNKYRYINIKYDFSKLSS